MATAQMQQQPKQQPACKVCMAAGLGHQAHTHSTRGGFDPNQEHFILGQGWAVIRPLGRVTLCPHIRSTVCDNPMCFNGNGCVRFPDFAHTRQYCPCAWPGQIQQMQPVQMPPVEEELFVENIQHIHDCDEQDAIAEELEFQMRMDDFIDEQDLEQENLDWYVEHEHDTSRSAVHSRGELFGGCRCKDCKTIWKSPENRKIQKILKKIAQVEAAQLQFEKEGKVEQNREHLLEPGLIESLQKQLE